MPLTLDKKHLYRALQKAKACTAAQAVPYRGEINEYLLGNYLAPYLQGNTPSVGDLDYSQFTAEDVRDFGNYLECADRTSAKLVGFCGVFERAKPIAHSNRIFC